MSERDDPDHSAAEQAFGGDTPKSGADAFGTPLGGGFEPPRSPGPPPPRRPERADEPIAGFRPPLPPSTSHGGPVAPPPPPRSPAPAPSPSSGPTPSSTWPPPASPHQPPVSNKATTAMVLGIVSWLVCPIVLSVMAMVFAQQAKQEIDANPTTVGGRGRAEAGFWIGLTSLIVYGLVIAVSIAIGLADSDS